MKVGIPKHVTLWCFIIPYKDNKQQYFASATQDKFHSVILKHSNGYTRCFSNNIIGVWINKDKQVVDSNSFYYVACDSVAADHIAKAAKRLFKQESIMYYLVSDDVRFMS